MGRTLVLYGSLAVMALLVGGAVDRFWVASARLDYDVLGLTVALPAWLGVATPVFLGAVLLLSWYERRTRRLDAADVGIILDASDEDEYNQMFDGFRRCEFLAFNPPFKVEGSPQDASFQKAVATHGRRYARGVQARYLFFDRERLERARRFFAQLREAGVPVEDHVQLALSPEGPHALTFFTGKRPTGFLKQVPEPLARGLDTEVVVMYPEELNPDGFPEAAVVIEGARSLHAALRRRFQRAWAEATVHPVGAELPAGAGPVASAA